MWTALAHAERGEVAKARAQLDAIVADSLFRSLTGAQRNALLSANATLAWQDDATARAAELMRAAIAADASDPEDHYRLAVMEFQLEDFAAASRRITEWIGQWPAHIDLLDRGFLTALLFRGSPDEADRRAVMNALFDAGWTDNGRGVADVWRELALLSLAANEQARAGEVIAGIADPLVLAKIRSDLRFDGMAPLLASLPSVEAAAVMEVERLQALSAAMPGRVDLAADLAAALLIAGREHEALAVTDAMLAAIDADGAEPFEFLDERVWLFNNRAIALRRMGRLDDAVAAFTAGSRLDEQGGVNVSQALNLGAFLCMLGRPVDAVRAIEQAGEMTGYGRMVQAGVRHCAALQSGDTASAASALAYMEAHAEDSPEILVNALLREQQVDRAAAALIKALDTPSRRAEALESLQVFRMPPALPESAALETGRARLLTRPDVQQAVARAGRILQHDVFALSGF
ncbi:hypothetical protein [Luteimonas deserti]|uniref:Tetratricopeptide repeat protein n=1 Tax=Luteimonas deserti TaxID=2752306 RepID=A0A7Z0TYV2_9GAMM|nr:hypothetical protein [Luteimonas deserti]NYZ61568.1 hypothetical protein [Luteimonas deserti]